MKWASWWMCAGLVGCVAPADSVGTVDDGAEASSGVSDESSSEDPVASEDTEDDTEEEEQEVQEDGCPDSWVLTYGLLGRVDITDTPLDIGNAEALVGGLESDELVLRLPDDDGVPGAGEVQLISLELLQDFEVSINLLGLGEIAIETYLMSTAADECGVALGDFQGASIEWDECVFGPRHGTNSWSPDEGADGAGCINDYRVEGVVECLDDSALASCADGWLEDGENALDYVYNQPMLDFEFDSADLQTFTMTAGAVGAELPTYTNNRTWLSLEGELKSMSLEPTPDCLCAEL